MAPRKTQNEKQKLAQLLGAGTPVCKALEMAGWTKRQASKGWDSVPQDVIKLLPKKSQRLIELGKTSKKDLEHLVIGRLTENVTHGKDGGAQSAKILGSHREINAWILDNQTGVTILNTPKEVLESKAEILAELDKVEGK